MATTTPRLGQTQYYVTYPNGTPQYVSLPWAGNDPYGYSRLTKDEYIQGLQGKLKTAQDFMNTYDTSNPFAIVPKNKTGWNGMNYSGQTYNQQSLSDIQNQINQVQSGQGIYADTYVDPGFSRFQPNAPTPSEQYYTPETFATLSPKEQQRLQATYPNSYANSPIGTVPAGMKEVRVGNVYMLIKDPAQLGQNATYKGYVVKQWGNGENITLQSPDGTEAILSPQESKTVLQSIGIPMSSLPQNPSQTSLPQLSLAQFEDKAKENANLQSERNRIDQESTTRNNAGTQLRNAGMTNITDSDIDKLLAGTPINQIVNKTTSTPTTQTPTQTSVTSPDLSGSTLKSGSTGDDVSKLQKYLNDTQNSGLAVDGKFGPATEAAVKAFQTSKGLTSDGIVGPNTLASINNTSTNNQSNTNTNTPENPATYSPADGHKLTPGEVVTFNGKTYTGINDTNTPTSTTGQLNLYGNERNQAGENFATQAIFSEADLGKSAAVGELTPAFVAALKNDPNKIAFYLGALAYGGYTMGDIYADMYSSQQKSLGKTVPDITIISPTMKKSDYALTDAGKAASTAIDTLLPAGSRMKTLNADIFKYSLANLPDDAFTPYADRLPQPGTPEWKQKASEIKASYYDLLTAQASADTEQDKSLADYNLQQFKDEMQRSLGITLSDNSTQAWKQIQTLNDTYNTRGIQQSGLRNEDVDNTLKSTRLADTRNRESALNETEKQSLAALKASGTSAQIAALSPEERQKLGLTPSSDVLAQFSIENIKKMDPTLTDAEAQAYRDTIIDENGNYRSTLYSNYYKKRADIGEQKKTYQNTTLTDINKQTEDRLAREKSLASSDNPFDTATLKPVTTNSTNASTGSVPTTPVNTGLQSAAAAASNLGTGIVPGSTPATPNTSTATTPTPAVPTPTQSNSPSTPATPTTNYDSWISGGNLQVGAKNAGVAGLQNYLGIASDSIFGPQTQSAVKAFQQRNGLTPDGIVGPNTIAAIKAGKK